MVRDTLRLPDQHPVLNTYIRSPGGNRPGGVSPVETLRTRFLV